MIFCKKLSYRIGNSDTPSILLGIVVRDQDGFVTFKTAKREYEISKRCVLKIEETQEVFRNGETKER